MDKFVEFEKLKVLLLTKYNKMGIWKQLVRKTKSTAVKICPKCYTPSLQKSSSGWMSTESYRCTECDYTGSFYLELDPNETGDKMADLDLLQSDFPEEREPETEVDMNEIIHQSKEIAEKSKRKEKADE